MSSVYRLEPRAKQSQHFTLVCDKKICLQTDTFVKGACVCVCVKTMCQTYLEQCLLNIGLMWIIYSSSIISGRWCSVFGRLHSVWTPWRLGWGGRGCCSQLGAVECSLLMMSQSGHLMSSSDGCPLDHCVTWSQQQGGVLVLNICSDLLFLLYFKLTVTKSQENPLFQNHHSLTHSAPWL